MITGYRLLAGNASAVLAGRVLAIALGVVLATVLFRALGAEQYGVWSLLTLISGYSTLIDFGLSSAVERRVASLTSTGATTRIPGTIVTTLVLLAGATLLVEGLVVLFLASPPGQRLEAGLRSALLVLPPCTGVTLASLALGAVLAGQQRMAVLHAWRSVGMAAGTLAVVLAVSSAVTSLAGLLVLYTSGSLLTIAAVWRSLRGSLPRAAGPGWDREALHDLLTYGGVLQGATMLPPVAEYVFPADRRRAVRARVRRRLRSRLACGHRAAQPRRRVVHGDGAVCRADRAGAGDGRHRTPGARHLALRRVVYPAGHGRAPRIRRAGHAPVVSAIPNRHWSRGCSAASRSC